MVQVLQRIAYSRWFHDLILSLILLSGVLVGMETYPRYHPDTPVGHVLLIMQDIILGIFVVEAAIKIGAYGRKPWLYFKNPWNVFDFTIIAICFLPIGAQFAMVFRMARLLRTLRLFTALPRLQVLVNALLKSIPSLGYVGVLLLLHFYIYAVMGTFLFQHNDPIRFGNLHSSMMTLFEVLTLEGWNDVFNTQMLGSNFTYSDEWRELAGTARVSTGRPIAAAAYFVSFILLGTMIMLNLFTGVIINSMQEAQAQHDEATVTAAAADEQANSTLAPANISDVDEKLRAIAGQLHEVSLDVTLLKDRMT